MSGVTTLRETWRTVRFGDVVQSVNRTTKDPGREGLERVVGLDQMDSESLILRRWELLSNLPDGTSFTRIFRSGQVLFGKRRAYQRKVSVADFDGVCSGDILVFQVMNEALLQEFLPFVVQSDGFFEHALGTSAGSLSPRTKWQELAKYEFALPPLEEQKRIVEVLRCSNDLTCCLTSTAAAANDLWLTIARRVFGGGVTTRLADRVDVLLGRQRHPKYAVGDHITPYMRAANVKNGYLDMGSVYSMNFNPAERLTYGLQKDDVLVSEGCGSIDEVGANAVWEGQLNDPVCFQKALIRLRAGPDTTPGLLRHWARFAFESGLFKTIARGTSIWHISAERTCELPYPADSLDRQDLAERELDEAATTLACASRHQSGSAALAIQLRERLLQEGLP